MKRLIIIIFLFPTIILSQNLPDPGTLSTTVFTIINSDYGPRNFTEGTNPHIGIDYNITSGNNAYSIENNSIDWFTQIGTINAQIHIGNFRYVHMEDDQTNDYHWEVYIDVGGNAANDIIAQRSGIYPDLITERIIGDQYVEIDQFIDPRTGQILSIEDNVMQDDWVFVANEGNHLHLDYNSGQLNPLRFVSHINELDPILNDFFKYELNGVANDFSNNVIYSNPVIIEIDVDIINDKDLNVVSINYKKDNPNYQQLFEWEYEGPGINTNEIIVLESLLQIQNAVDQAVYPAPGFVSRDILKYMWNTRLNVNGNISSLNDDAIYKDGDYEIQIVASDITNNTTTVNTTKIIDNFPPYVKKVEILEGPSCNETKYSAEWQWTNGNLVFSPNTYPVIAKPTSMWSRVIVTFSEEMQNTELTIQGLDIYNRLPLPETFGENQKGWQLNIDDFNGVSSGEFSMEFVNCTDLANTSLYGFNNTSSLPGASIPKRQANGVWSPSYSNHIDNIHSFSIVFSDIDIDFEASSSGLPINGATKFSNTSTNVPLATHWWKWEFEGGEPSEVYQEYIGGGGWNTENIYYIGAGEFDVTLKQMDPDYEVVYASLTKEDYILVGNVPDANFEALPLEANIGETILFTDLSSGNPISWLWNFSDGSSSTVQNPAHSFSLGGEYTIVLKATNQYGPNVETKEDYITIFDPRPDPNFNTNDGITNIQPYTLVDFIDQSSNNPNNWQWTFEGAAPNTSTVQDPSNINYPTTGVYNVTLSVSNEYGTRIITKENFIEVSNNAIGLEVDCWSDNFICNIGETVTFTASVLNGTPPYTYTFNFNGSLQTFNSSAQTYSASHVFNTSGNMTISVTVSDYEDKYNSCTNSVTIEPIGGAHNVDFTWSPSSPILGQDISFQNLTSGGAEPYLQSYWEWFEDPNTGNPSWAPHSEIVWTPNALSNPPFAANYDELGDYPVKLIVSDAMGFPKEKTKIIHFIPADECIFFEGNSPLGFLHPYPQVGIQSFFQSNGYCCYSSNCLEYEFKKITNLRWTLFDANTGSFIPGSEVYKENNCSCYNIGLNGTQECQDWYDVYTNKGVFYSFNINDDKEYIIQCEIWNKCFGENQGTNQYLPGLLEPAQAPSLPYYDVAYSYFRVIDCNNAETYTMNITTSNNPEVWAGYITLGGTEPHTIQLGGEATYVAHQEITMANNFSAFFGSSFTARIEPCPDYTEIDEIFMQNHYIERSLMSLPKKGTDINFSQVSLEIYPNPSKGIFNVSLSHNLSIQALEVLSDIGTRILLDEDINTSRYQINIEDYPNGVYFVKVLSNEKVFIEKIIKQ